jgi:hypothetical protein
MMPRVVCHAALHRAALSPHQEWRAKYSSCNKPIRPPHKDSKLLLTDMKVVVTPDAVKELEPRSSCLDIGEQSSRSCQPGELHP